MLELPHTLVGAVIATRISEPLVSLPLAFLSHFWLDVIPHWNPNLYTEKLVHGRPLKKSAELVAADTLVSLGAGSFFAWRFWPDWQRIIIIYLACFLAVVPDVIEGLYFFAGVNSRFLVWLVKFQRSIQGKAGKKLGLAIQLMTIILALVLLK
ncbi:MAG: hypothetical protein ABH807_00175 [Candidatus Shapirobacteria bacterium]